MEPPTPHYEKLKSVLENAKLPISDRKRVEEALIRYEKWISCLNQCVPDSANVISTLVDSLNDYKNYIDLNLIFDAKEDFLYRQKGQLKIDNSIIEEFLPWLIQKSVLPSFNSSLIVGPTHCFSSLCFTSSLDRPGPGGIPQIRSKDQDFAISRKIYLKTSYDLNFENADTATTYIAYIAAEVKTNLDKTMFQEACATAHDVKTSVAGSKYFLLCEWLDMTPISTAATDIDEVLILRKSKRLSSNIRKNYGTYQGRMSSRSEYRRFLENNPFQPEIFRRFVDHINSMISTVDPVEQDVLKNGYF